MCACGQRPPHTVLLNNNGINCIQCLELATRDANSTNAYESKSACMHAKDWRCRAQTSWLEWLAFHGCSSASLFRARCCDSSQTLNVSVLSTYAGSLSEFSSSQDMVGTPLKIVSRSACTNRIASSTSHLYLHKHENMTQSIPKNTVSFFTEWHRTRTCAKRPRRQCELMLAAAPAVFAHVLVRGSQTNWFQSPS